LNSTVKVRAYVVLYMVKTGISLIFLVKVKVLMLRIYYVPMCFILNASPKHHVSNGAGLVSSSWDGLKTQKQGWSDRIFCLDGCEEISMLIKIL